MNLGKKSHLYVGICAIILLIIAIIFLDSAQNRELPTVWNFESGTFEGWDAWTFWPYCGDSNETCDIEECYLGKNTTPFSWDMRRPNSDENGCMTTGLGTVLVNHTLDGLPVLGKYALGIGHLENWTHVLFESKIDVRRNISVPEYGNTTFYFFIKWENHAYLTSHIEFQVIVKEGDKYTYLFEKMHMERTSDWALYNVSLNNFRGKNITLILRADTYRTGYIDVLPTMMYFDNMSIVTEGIPPISEIQKNT